MIEGELEAEGQITPALIYQYRDNSQTDLPQKLYEKMQVMDKSITTKPGDFKSQYSRPGTATGFNKIITMNQRAITNDEVDLISGMKLNMTSGFSEESASGAETPAFEKIYSK